MAKKRPKKAKKDTFFEDTYNYFSPASLQSFKNVTSKIVETRMCPVKKKMRKKTTRNLA